MDYIVRPIEALQGVLGNPASDPDYYSRLVVSRQRQLEALREHIIRRLDLAGAEGQRGRESMRILAGTGQLLISGSVQKSHRLLSVPGIVAVLDESLPTTQQAAYATNATPAQPWHLSMINKPAGLTGAGYSIGVIDYGYDPAIPDLIAPFTATFAEYKNGSPGEMVTGNPPVDYSTNQHGSTVCSFLAGTASGVAPGATILVAGVPASSALGNQSLVVLALNWLLTASTGLAGRTTGCDVITTSLLVSSPGHATAQAVDDALMSAATFKTLVIASIGNVGASGKTQGCGSSSHVVGVGAVNAGGHVFGSAWGSVGGGAPKPDIVAPGYELELPDAGGGQRVVNGTSFATPIVAGAAALILERKPALRHDPVSLRTKLLGFTTKPASSPAGASGSGLLDLSTL